MQMAYTLDPVPARVTAWLTTYRKHSESLRAKAAFNTGTISLAAMAYLYTLCARWRPTTVIEVGTFIGNSTVVFSKFAQDVYTCDKDNDCVRATPGVHPHPKTTSTQMLWDLVHKGVKADLFFFDGRIQGPDVALILRCSTRHTIYLFDDYERMEKGALNVDVLFHYLPEHQLVQPPAQVEGYDTTTSIAALVPKELI